MQKKEKESVRLVVYIDSELKRQLRELSGDAYGAQTALGVEILTEAVNNYTPLVHALPPSQASVERYDIRVPPELSEALRTIAVAEVRTQKAVVARMLREGVEKRLSKNSETSQGVDQVKITINSSSDSSLEVVDSRRD